MGIAPWLLVLSLGCLPADEPTAPIKSPVGVVLDEVQRARSDAMKVRREAVEARRLPPDQQEAEWERARDQYIAALAPQFDRLLASAAAHPDDPSSVPALAFVAIEARGWESDQATRALVALRRDHARSPGISEATGPAFANYDRPEAETLCRAVLAENLDRIERGRACSDLAFLLTYCSKRIRGVRSGASTNPLPARLVAANPDLLQTEAIALYERCVAEFADVPAFGYGEGKPIGDFARGALVDLRDIQVGRPTLDIVGEDIDGKPLRLADHRGKVVVLVFAGEWCGPCKAQAPKYRELLQPEAQQANPCVVLEVNTDATRDPVRKAIDAKEITWPCWFDGGTTTGPITMAWGIASFPTVHVIDAAGIIRARDVRGPRIASAVAEAQTPLKSAPK